MYEIINSGTTNFLKSYVSEVEELKVYLTFPSILNMKSY